MRLHPWLLGIALVGPAVAYGATSTLLPDDSAGATLDPGLTPLRFFAGQDYAVAERAGLVDAFVVSPDHSFFVLRGFPIAGGIVVVDDLLRVEPRPQVESYQLEIAEPLTGPLTPPVELKLRLWQGPQAPTSDDAASVCAVLDLTGPLGSATLGRCAGTARVQWVAEMGPGAQGLGTVAFRPSGIQA